ncbi:MAG: NADH-quinone oxidoreductase subunit A [Fibrobacter sp.]|jgi:NADH-quinone oxidoreductase subunit A|nr:NADH-quinone oxidoreductase subunit A [Fibrobacter sp.]
MNLTNIEVFDTTFAMTVLILLAIVVPLALLAANWVLHPGKIKKTEIKGSAYECGHSHVSGTAGEHYPVKYYMVAMLFLVFDLEVAFLYPWVVQFLKGGWNLLFVLLGFLLILEAGYLYLYRKGVLNWARVSD